MKTLLVMRHAKSDWDAEYKSDHDRPLNDRGVRSARVIGRVLARDRAQPNLVITSSALRARSTAELAMEAGGWGAGMQIEPDLYGGGPDTAIQVAAGAQDPPRLMLVGHQPTWSMLVSMLTDRIVEMKTATVAVIAFDIDSWSELPGVTGEIETVYQPRDLLGTPLDVAPG